MKSKRSVVVLFAFCLALIIPLVLSQIKFSKDMSMVKSFLFKRKLNVVFIGPAGSGKGTQADLIKDSLNLLKVSAGDILREYRKNPNNEYSKVINQLIDKGALVPSDIVNKIISQFIDNEMDRYDGVLFDGFPRQINQYYFLKNHLKKYGSKVDAVIHLDISVDKLYERLKDRYSCVKCGEIYHRVEKNPKVAGVCDRCGGRKFSARADDSDKNAIAKRLAIFNEDTKAVLDKYIEEGVVHVINADRPVQEVYQDVVKKINSVIDKK